MVLQRGRKGHKEGFLCLHLCDLCALVVNDLLGRGHVKNIAAAISHFLSKDWASSAVFNLGDPIALSEAQWVEHIAGIAGWTGKIAIVPDDQLPDPLKVPFNATQNWTVDASRFRSETGFTEPFTVKESLEETITWLRSNPPSVPAERLERWEQEDGAEDQWLART